MKKIDNLEERIKELEESLSAKEKMCEVLMKRAERSMDSTDSAFSIFERNILLQNLVDQRSKELEEANRKLSEEIIEHKKLVEALSDSKDFLNKLINSVPIPIFYKNTEGCYMGFNKAFEKVLGFTEEHILGKTAFDVSPAELAEIYHAKDMELLETKGELQYESKVRNVNGEIRDVIVNKAVFTNSRGDAIGIIGTIIDITERKQVLEQLHKSRKRYKDIFDNAVEGIFQATLENRFRNVNPALASMFGYESPQEMILEVKDIAKQVYADIEDLRNIVRLLMENHSAREYELQVKRKDGSIFWVSMNIHSMHDAEGNLLYIEGSILDITGRKAAALEREKLINELQQALENVNVLSGLLPICANCKKIRDDSGYWNQIESYISKHSNAVFSHGLCPECARKLYPEIYED